MGERNLTLLTDLYELTMMQGYYKTGNRQLAVFDAFYRTNPCGGGYAICAGLEQIIEYIKGLRFTDEDIDYLRSLRMFDEEFLSYLSDYHFGGDIYAVPEGTVVFPHEPLVKVIAPLFEAQLLETTLLNILNHQSLIATKASRVVEAASGDPVMEFGLRRAQGPDAGIYGARAAIIGGCSSTSNVLSGAMFGVPVIGTHAHSWIMSFPSEYEAFKAYSELYPTSCILLVDTYDTLRSGVPNAIRVFTEMRENGSLPEKGKYGIRLDSGDLAYMSKKAYAMLEEAGFADAVISGSSDLDEYLITSLKNQGAKINSWGVGTKMITASDNPSFGGVYKLAAIKEPDAQTFTPKIKVSENIAKVTNPGDKTIYRIYDNASGKIIADLICLVEEVFDPQDDLVLFDQEATWKKKTLTGGSYTLRELMVPVFENGVCVYDSPETMELRKHCIREKASLWDEVLRLVNPPTVNVHLSDRLFAIKTELLREAHA